MRSYLYKILFNGRFLPKKLAEILDDFEARISHLEGREGAGMAVYIKFTDLNGLPIKGVKVTYNTPKSELPEYTTKDDGIVLLDNIRRNAELNFDYSCIGYKSGNWNGSATESMIRITLHKDDGKSNTVNNSSNKKKR